MERRFSWWLVVAALTTLAVGKAGAQGETGTIVGRVTDAATQQPLVGVQVTVVGRTIGTITSDAGTYRLTGVPPGQITLRALRIGYQAVTRPVTVVAGQTDTVDFAMRVAATQLDVQVVTATGETQRRRETGNAVASVDSSRLNPAVNANFAQALAAKAPGVNIQQPGGTTGGGSRVRIRGSNSVSLSNEPLLIVDGVRISNNANSAQPGGTGIGVGGQTISRFNDINPEDIENIEIIKGPAAAALYGTAAANGVIQVTTKRGRPGRTRWNTFAEYGTINDIYDYPSNYSNVGQRSAVDTTTVVNCTIDKQAQGLCVSGQLASFNPLATYRPFDDGFRSQFGLSASGGREGATYYVGGDFEREQGLAANNLLRRGNLRANINAQVSEQLSLAVSTGYLSSDLGLPQNENNALGYLSAGLLGKAFNCAPGIAQTQVGCVTRNAAGVITSVDTVSYGFFSRNPREFYFLETEQDVDKFTGGLTANWQPSSWLRGTLTSGLDILNRQDKYLNRPNISDYSTGILEGLRIQNRTQEFTYSTIGNLGATYNVTEDLQLTSSLGGQYIREGLSATLAQGRRLLPGTGSLAGVSAGKDVGEINQTIVTVSAFGEQRLAWRDRLFLSAALRGDDNSNFGEEFGLVVYPSVSASWVLSEEPFFPATTFLSQLRLRSAYGRSGQRPGFRQAETYFDPVAVNTIGGGDVPAAVIGGTGNLELKPEISGEFESGVDAAFFDNRLGIEATYYDKTTRDALIAVPLAPSLGLSNTRFANLGQVNNRGFELGVNATAFDTPRAKLDLTLSFSTNRNRLLELGRDEAGNPLPAIVFNGNTQQHTEGRPLGAFYAPRITSFTDKNGDGILSRVGCRSYVGVTNPGGATTEDLPSCEITLSDSAEFLGAPLPTRELSFNPALTLFGWLRVQALIDYRGGHRLLNFTREFRCASFQQCYDIQSPEAPLADQAKAVARLMGSSAGYIEDASFTRFRELSFTATAPERLTSRFGSAGLSLTLGVQNLATWTNYTGFDPEVQSGASSPNAFTSFDFFGQAPLRRLNARLNVTF